MRACLKGLVMMVIFVSCFQAIACALSNDEMTSQLQFNFLTPGARATALGGAFIGLSDDATAVESNPAGLTILKSPEISLEFKHLTYTVEPVYANRTPETDITRREFDNSIESVSFISAVYPYKRFIFSLYRQEWVNYESSYRTDAYPIYLPGIEGGFLPGDRSVDLTITNYGFGIAVQLLEGLSFAVSPRRSEMKMRLSNTMFDAAPGPTTFMEDDIWIDTKIDDEDSGYSLNAGILWKLHPKISIGTVYKTGTTFKAKRTYFSRSEESGEMINIGRFYPDFVEFTLRIPTSYGTGIAFRATDYLTFTLDVMHIHYEDLLEDFDLSYLASDVYSEENYTIDNTTEFHVGMEYIIPFDERFLALRAGIYTEPDHSLHFTGTTGDPDADLAGKTLFPGGKDQLHLTGGLGLVVNERLQLDTAVNIADHSSQISLSAVYRF